MVGSDPEASARTMQLERCGAVVRRVDLPFAAATLEGATLVLVGLDVAGTQATAIAQAARAARVLVHVADRPDLSDLALPAVTRRGLLSVAVSTSGASPLLAKRLRDELERVLPERLAALTDSLAVLRDQLRERPAEERRARYEQAVAGLRLEGRLLLPGDPPGDDD